MSESFSSFVPKRSSLMLASQKALARLEPLPFHFTDEWLSFHKADLLTFLADHYAMPYLRERVGIALGEQKKLLAFLEQARAQDPAKPAPALYQDGLLLAPDKAASVANDEGPGLEAQEEPDEDLGVAPAEGAEEGNEPPDGASAVVVLRAACPCSVEAACVACREAGLGQHGAWCEHPRHPQPEPEPPLVIHAETGEPEVPAAPETPGPATPPMRAQRFALASPEERARIRQAYTDGKSVAELARETSIKPATIYGYLKGLSNRQGRNGPVKSVKPAPVARSSVVRSTPNVVATPLVGKLGVTPNLDVAKLLLMELSEREAELGRAEEAHKAAQETYLATVVRVNRLRKAVAALEGKYDDVEAGA